MELVKTSPSRFFDGDAGWPSDLGIELERVTTPEGAEEWAMLRRVGYRVRKLGTAENVDLIVPAKAIQKPPPPEPGQPATKRFTTDLTSVPQLLTWLVPKSGTHLPAALLHDGLVTDGAPEHDGPPVTRIEADRIFREAMADLDTPLLRRWIVWTAVTLATLKTVRPWPLRVVMYAALGVVAVLGYIATLDLFDQVQLLCWMGDRPWNRELIYGVGMAVAVPFAVCLPWLIARLYRAGWIAGLAIAVLFHVMLAVVAVSTAFQLGEWVAQRVTHQGRPVRVRLALAALAGMIVLTVFTVWLCRRNP